MEKPKREVESKQESKFSDWLIWSIIVGIIYGLIARTVVFDFGSRLGPPITLTFLVAVPISIIAVTLYLNRDHWMDLPLWLLLLRGFFTMFFFVVFAGMMATDAWICVCMAAPFLIGFGLVGVAFIRTLYKAISRFTDDDKQKRKYQSSIIFVLLLAPYILSPIETQIASPEMLRTVEDSIIIQASPEIVWENIIRMDTITPDEQSISFYQSAGIPRPVRATLDGEGVGAIRHGEFEHGLAFVEEITIWEPYQRVHFEIDVNQDNLHAPALLEIGGRYFDILDAGYTIEQLDDGSVRLSLNSTYRLTTNFNGYAALWADLIMHDFQSYVLHVVKQRTEALSGTS